jgi:hypothetical protein
VFHCPLCHTTAHARTSRYFTDTTKERYHQCTNINCSCTFVTTETVLHCEARRSDSGVTSPDIDGAAAALDVKRNPRDGGVPFRTYNVIASHSC